MSNIAGSAIYSSANTSTSTLRPRNNRLISYLDEPSADNDTPGQVSSTSSSRGGSPSTVQPRSRNVAQPFERQTKQVESQTTSNNTARRPSALWDSWSSIQGVASSLLGGGERSASPARKNSLKTPAWMKQDPRYKASTTTPKWGPSSKDTTLPDSGSIEDRQALVQAKKREALLLSCAQEGRDELGHFKRKASYDAGSRVNAADPDLDTEALVYKHNVQPRDTLAGVTIRYSCQPEAFRKLNRFWPNDNIQTRKYVLLPVEACSIRGKKLDDANSLELLTRQLNKIELDSNQRSTTSNTQRILSNDTSPVLTSPKQISADEEEFKHDSYVILPSFPEPVEIIRIPRRTLGYFPRARRKSNHLAPDSVTSTPKTSFDMLRHPPTHAAQQAAALLSNSYTQGSQSLTSSPGRRPGLSATSRQRSSSTTTATSSNSANAWILRGPGGVGNLRGLRTEVSRPGPAADPLNQNFNHYFPGLAIQKDSDNHAIDGNSNEYLHPRSRTNTASRSPYKITPRASIDSIRSTRSNSSTFGAGVAGVESFMRKLASGSGKRPELGQRSNSGSLGNAMGLPLGGETGLGDLIELETNPDALHTDHARGERGRSGAYGGFGQSRYDNDDDEDEATPTEVSSRGREQDLLDERFPVRGRITRAYVGDDG